MKIITLFLLLAMLVPSFGIEASGAVKRKSPVKKTAPARLVNQNDIQESIRVSSEVSLVKLSTGWGVMNTTSNRLIIPAVYQWINNSDSGFIAKDNENMTTLFRKDGSKIGKYSRVDDYYGGDYVLVGRNGKIGFVNPKTGRLIVPVEYDDWTPSGGKIVVSKKTKTGEYLTVYTKNGKKITTKYFKDGTSSYVIQSWAERYGLL